MPRRKAPTMKQLQRDVAEVMERVRHYVLEPAHNGEEVDMGLVARLTTAYVQTVQTYMKVAEAADLQPQIEEIREELREIREGAIRA